jgi:hypothetical protein
VGLALLIAGTIFIASGLNPSVAHSAIPEIQDATAWQTSDTPPALSEETLAACANSPLYPVGSLLITQSAGYLEDSTGFMIVPAGTQLKITGPVIDGGICDDWPVEATAAASVSNTCDVGSVEFDEICTVDGGERGHILEVVFHTIPDVEAPQPQEICDPSYPDVCIPPPPPDLDCSDIPFGSFRVVGADPHRFDGPYDGSNPYEPDGLGCEWN